MVIPAATSMVVGLSMYFSISRSLFHDMYRNNKLAVLGCIYLVKIYHDDMLERPLTSTNSMPQISSMSSCISCSTAVWLKDS
jgi:hypothetical protein